MEDGSPISGMVIILFLILSNAIIVSANNAMNHLNESSVKRKADSGSKGALRLIGIMEKSGRYQNVMELIQSFISVVIGIIFFAYFLPGIDLIAHKSDLALNIHLFRPIYYVIFTILLVYITVIFGLIIPRRIATKHAEALAIRMTGMIQFLGFIFYPITWLLEIILNILLRLFGIKHFDLSDNVTEEEIISMMNEGQEQGVLNAGEVEMISNIMELGDKEAQDIMTPKKKIITVNTEISLEEALKFMLSGNYSRYPLYEGNMDNIIGILHLKDVISAYISEELKNAPLAQIAREPFFVPDTQNINILFHDMQSKNIHMAIVIDEYGQTAGLVAMEDFLEEIVGNIQDEYDVEESMVIAIEGHKITVKGSISLEELEDETGIRIHNEDFDTLNGLLISIMDRIPQDGERETLIYQGYQFDVLETMDKMIQKVRIIKIAEPDVENMKITISES